MSNYTICPIFPTTVQLNKLDYNFSSEEFDYILNLPQIKNPLNSSSIEKYVLNQPKLLNLKNKIEEALKHYFYEVIKANKNLEIYITQSWVNFIQEAQSHHRHTHSNSYLSGVLYITADEKVDRINFYRQKYDQISITNTEWNLFNSEEWFFNVNTSDLLIFPSTLSHAVKSKEGNNTRISLAFNSFIKGNLGDNFQANELILQ